MQLSDSNRIEAVLERYLELMLPVATIELSELEVPSELRIRVTASFEHEVTYSKRDFDREKLGPDMQAMTREMRAHAVVGFGLVPEIEASVRERVEELKQEWIQEGYRQAVKDLNITTIKE